MTKKIVMFLLVLGIISGSFSLVMADGEEVNLPEETDAGEEEILVEEELEDEDEPEVEISFEEEIVSEVVEVEDEETDEVDADLISISGTF